MIEVASAAKRAVDQSADADRRCAELTELVERACEQASSVRHVAASLTDTAATVARLALDVCRYDSFQQAFQLATTHHDATIDVDTFLSVVENTASLVQRDHTAGACSEEQARHHDESTITDHSTDDCPSSSFHSVSVPSMYAHFLCLPFVHYQYICGKA